MENEGTFNLACPQCQCIDFYIRSTCTLKLIHNFKVTKNHINSPAIPATFVYVCAGCGFNTQGQVTIPVIIKRKKKEINDETNSES
jgi:hypothetical protein